MNGAPAPPSDTDDDGRRAQILHALEALHNPSSTNDLRRDASKYLEDQRADPRAPYNGYVLASTPTLAPIVRHYGLSLIEYAVRYKSADHSPDESQALRGWIWSLAQHADASDPAFVTNKVAEIWVELAKRQWGIEWLDMDELLVRLWEGEGVGGGGVAQKQLVLTVLEQLSEEVFGGLEDSVVVGRGSELNRACVEVFTPVGVLREHFPNREKGWGGEVRWGGEGWVGRLSYVLSSCVTGEGKVLGEWRGVVMGILKCWRSVVGWVVPGALVVANVLPRLCACLAVDEMGVQLGAMETLHILFYRSKFTQDDFENLVGPMFEADNLGLLRNLYQWLSIDPASIDDAKYLLLKKLSEIVYNIGSLLAQRPAAVANSSYDLSGFLSLLLDIAKNPSLQVSIPAVHLWAKLLAVEQISKSSAAQALIGDLLESCSQRLVRYEVFPVDSNNPSIMFLNEDIETIPERHAFLGNYSRFCNQIVELVVEQQPIDALYHILGQSDQALDHLYDGEPPFQPALYAKNSVPYLKLDAQFSVIEAALKGFSKWLTSADSPSEQHQQGVMISNLQVWCDRLLGLEFEDPQIKERVTQLTVGFATGPLKRDSKFAVRVFDKILETRCASFPECAAYTEAVKDLQLFCVHQMQRVAMRFADHLVTIYDEVERKIMAVSQSAGSDQHYQARYYSILFVIMHRASSVDVAPREARLEQMVHPVIEQWQDSKLSDSLSSMHAFAELLGMGGLQQYFMSRNVQNIEDWSSFPLDDEGKALQLQINNSLDGLPLRATKQLMSVSVEKLQKSSQPYEMACRLWHDKLASILPNLLRLIELSQQFQDPTNWSNMPPEMAPVVRRIFTDRFWQVGISQGSRDQFYAQIGDTKSSMEGLASSIRAITRTLRETGYRILFYMSLLGDRFYSFPELPGPLSRALFADSCILSPHQISILVDMVRPIIDTCPLDQQSHFLPPMLSALFEQVDRKAIAEWERIEEARTRAAAQDDDLTTEMKDESILRQMTMASVWLVVGLLDQSKPSNAKPQPNGTTTAAPPTPNPPTRTFILHTPLILKPLILFCTHALQMRDTRACALITKTLRTLVPAFTPPSPSTTSNSNPNSHSHSSHPPIDPTVAADVREFISTSVLKACIHSLHDAYFVELQKDFATLIAAILHYYAPLTDTPKQVLMELPGLGDGRRVEEAVRGCVGVDVGRGGRGVVLELLGGLRAVGVSELGKVEVQGRAPGGGKVKSRLQAQYEAGMIKEERKSPDLGGVADMFGGGDG